MLKKICTIRSSLLNLKVDKHRLPRWTLSWRNLRPEKDICLCPTLTRRSSKVATTWCSMMMTRESSNTEWMTMMPELNPATSPRWTKPKKMCSTNLEPNWTLQETMMTINSWLELCWRRRLLVSTAWPQTSNKASWKWLWQQEIRWLQQETPKESQMIPPELPLDITDKIQPAETISIWREWLKTKPILHLEAKINTWTRTWATTRMLIWRTCPTKRNTCTCKRWTPCRT